jgi:hypothetical protein
VTFEKVWRSQIFITSCKMSFLWKSFFSSFYYMDNNMQFLWQVFQLFMWPSYARTIVIRNYHLLTSSKFFFLVFFGFFFLLGMPKNGWQKALSHIEYNQNWISFCCVKKSKNIEAFVVRSSISITQVIWKSVEFIWILKKEIFM